ncbi:MAG: hypothetical protein ACD_77C00021G0003 [uncultured bacterium]|nr:MAG: hypothetical protein ACD_77C00021G0003 [uncultured bacterium]
MLQKQLKGKRKNISEKMNSKNLLRLNKLIAFLLSILGFTTACTDNFRMEYGVPRADFIVKGSVLSETDNSPLRNIRLIFRDTTNQYISDTTFTDINGSYLVEMSNFPKDQKLKLNLQDVDGATNGEFNSQETTVEFKNPQFTNGDKHWYSGKVEQELIVKMKPKP